jgi:predicted amidohydrolase YtcJ
MIQPLNDSPESKCTIIENAQIFTGTPGDDALIAGSIIVDDGTINYVGPSPASEVSKAREAGASVVDAAGQVVAPAFIDSHVHIMHFGHALGKLNVLHCQNLDSIRTAIKEFAAAHPQAPRLLCKGWLQSSVAGRAAAKMLDDLDPRPIYVEAMDLHSVWCNTAALKETGVWSMKEDPAGGTIVRDEHGRPTGLLEESALHSIVVPFLMNALTGEEKQEVVRQAFTTYFEAGYTGVIDMAMDDGQWDAIKTYRDKNDLRLHIAAHWLIPYGNDEEIESHLQQAIEMNRRYSPATSPEFCVVGIKIIGDGTVDGCTAGLSKPYGHLNSPCHPIWPAATLERTVARADSANLQVAIHAIGDTTIKNAIDAIAALGSGRRQRHRIEHLELASEADARRLGELGIIASVQPVHSDPVLFRAWPNLLGAHRCTRAFAYREFLEGGAPMAFGTDAPTAAHWPLPNLYNATTRRSALEPDSEERTNEAFKVPFANAVRASTSGAAFSRRAEGWCGQLRAGMRADLIMLETDWKPEGLLQSRVNQTWAKGRKVFDAGDHTG